jgi:predicted DNA-binding transcriptional regulator AlpA
MLIDEEFVEDDLTDEDDIADAEPAAAEVEDELTDEDLDEGGLKFEDLKRHKVVSSRSDLGRKQKELGFPLAIKTGPRQAMFLKSEVRDWLRKRAAMRGKPKPAVKPPVAAKRVGKKQRAHKTSGRKT